MVRMKAGRMEMRRDEEEGGDGRRRYSVLENAEDEDGKDEEVNRDYEKKGQKRVNECATVCRRKG